MWPEKNAAAANTWPQPAEWPAEHYNAACVRFLLSRNVPRSLRPVRAERFRVIPASSLGPDKLLISFLNHEMPRPPFLAPFSFPFPFRRPGTRHNATRRPATSPWEPGQFREKTCVLLFQDATRLLIELVPGKAILSASTRRGDFRFCGKIGCRMAEKFLLVLLSSFSWKEIVRVCGLLAGFGERAGNKEICG